MAFSVGSPISSRRRLQLIKTYLPDWIITIVVYGLFILLNKVDGFRREFDLNDTSIQHRYAEHERISALELYLISVVAPAVIVLLVSIFYMRSFYDLHAGWLGLLLTVAINNTITDIVKIVVGRPRPDLLDRCQPRADVTNAAGPGYGLSTSEICTRTELLPSGFRSFPSGHSSLSAAGLIYLTLFLAGKMHIHDSKGFALKTWLLAVPVMGAVLVAVSRTMDYRHHATDVLAGSALGTAVAWFIYRQYFPALSDPRCDKPYSPRVPRDADDVEGQQDPEHVSLTKMEPGSSRRSGRFSSASDASSSGAMMHAPGQGVV